MPHVFSVFGNRSEMGSSCLVLCMLSPCLIEERQDSSFSSHKLGFHAVQPWGLLAFTTEYLWAEVLSSCLPSSRGINTVRLWKPFVTCASIVFFFVDELYVQISSRVYFWRLFSAASSLLPDFSSRLSSVSLSHFPIMVEKQSVRAFWA